MKLPDVNIKEKSWLAAIAAWKLGSKSVAMVIGKTIHLHNVTKADFLSNEKWVKHEMCHIRQSSEEGHFIFIVKYLWESLRKGYYNNKYEREARAAEHL